MKRSLRLKLPGSSAKITAVCSSGCLDFEVIMALSEHPRGLGFMGSTVTTPGRVERLK